MSGRVEFCFDFVSPMSYFAFHRLREIQSRTGCEVDYKPVWLFEVMKQSGNQPPGTIPAKRDFYFSDTVRHAKRYNLPWKWNADFPLNTLHLLRMTSRLLLLEVVRLVTGVSLLAILVVVENTHFLPDTRQSPVET